MDIKQEVAELLVILKQGIVEGKELITTQFPILCQQIVKWGIWGNIFQIVIFSIMLYISYRLMRLGFKKLNESGEEGWGILFIGSILGVIFSNLFLLISIYNLLRVLSAPNLYILEYLKEVMK